MFGPPRDARQSYPLSLLPLTEGESRLSIKGVKLLALNDVKAVVVDLLHYVEGILLTHFLLVGSGADVDDPVFVFDIGLLLGDLVKDLGAMVTAVFAHTTSQRYALVLRSKRLKKIKNEKGLCRLTAEAAGNSRWAPREKRASRALP